MWSDRIPGRLDGIFNGTRFNLPTRSLRGNVGADANSRLNLRTPCSPKFCGRFDEEFEIADLQSAKAPIDEELGIGFDYSRFGTHATGMNSERIQAALADIFSEKDPTLKSLKLASVCSALWRERGVELVVVGGSAIEFLTEGAYASGDLDLCHLTAAMLPIRDRQEIMGRLGAEGGPRNWRVAGMYLDLLGLVESFAQTPYRRVEGPYGSVLVMKAEDLLVERVLVSVYPQPNAIARACARELAVVALGGAMEMNWNEVLRVAELPEYRNVEECKALVREVADELKVKYPFDSD